MHDFTWRWNTDWFRCSKKPVRPESAPASIVRPPRLISRTHIKVTRWSRDMTDLDLPRKGSQSRSSPPPLSDAARAIHQLRILGRDPPAAKLSTMAIQARDRAAGSCVQRRQRVEFRKLSNNEPSRIYGGDACRSVKQNYDPPGTFRDLINAPHAAERPAPVLGLATRWAATPEATRPYWLCPKVERRGHAARRSS